MAQRLKVLQLGLGPIGREAARLAVRRERLEVVGAVDIDPALAGEDLFGLLELPSGGRRIAVDSDLSEALARLEPEVVLQTTGSRLKATMGQIEEVLGNGVNLVSTCEELLYPFRRHPSEAKRLDALARGNGVSVLATGVNPGFAMDTLALFLSGVCRRVDSVTIRRIVDASSRRGPLQKKIGAGLGEEEFRRRVAALEVGHVGLVESLDLLAASLGLEVERIDETIEPVLAPSPLRTDFVSVETGQVAGIHHTAVGRAGSRALISLDLSMFIGAPAPVDEVTIEGDPPIRNRVEGGIPGDAATVGILVNSAARVAAAGAGLMTMADVPPVICFR